MGIAFEILHTAGESRLGRLRTPHGEVDTPAFMPVGTVGSVKGVTPHHLAETGAGIILANTYHLQLRPGAEVVESLGGLHRFMGWPGPILTDSGGYQVFSLAQINKITDESVTFRSHVDGALLHLDPVSATRIQNQLGADIIMAFDQCPPLPGTPELVRTAVDRTIRWAAECRRVHARPEQAMFGIVQGGLDVELRLHCAARIIDIGFDGYAIGGLSVGETHAEMVEVLKPVAAFLPADRPRYLMGVGMPGDIYEAVKAGVDMFDCVLPTRNGRNAEAFTARGTLKLRNEQHRLATGPIEADCDCYACRRFSLGYVRHLFVTREMLGPILASIHNLRFFQRFMARLRELIRQGRLDIIPEEYPIVRETLTPEGCDT
ncbi:MAG: tRNA guanosine(34) transglycosylase Tgt [Phycisphaerales bacterium]|nr:tRNA guanosine(34) transglycosylase Tgt [Phycisphaerales bacterium]